MHFAGVPVKNCEAKVMRNLCGSTGYCKFIKIQRGIQTDRLELTV